jgi:uncharacterized protein YrrD
MDTKKLKGIAVVTVEGGEKVGNIEDILFNTSRRCIQAFRVSSGGLFGSNQRIELADVGNIGTDAVMVHDRSVLRDEPRDRDQAEYPNLDSITSLSIVTRSGDYVGNVGTVDVDEHTGKLPAVEASGGGIVGMFMRKTIPMDQVISIGRDVMVIPDSFAQADVSDKERKGSPSEGGTMS